MLPRGRIYRGATTATPYSATTSGPEVVVQAAADSTMLVLEMWMTGTPPINQGRDGVEIVRTSGLGLGGINLSWKGLETGAALFGGDAKAKPTAGWTTIPTVTDVLGGAQPVDPDLGWYWSYRSGGPIVVSPSQFIGFRRTETFGASHQRQYAFTVLEVGG